MPSPTPAGPATGFPIPAPIASGVKGILDCPTVAYPGSVVSAMKQTTNPPPATFGTYCAACHGAAGEGRPGYPALTTVKLTFSEFATVVRNGRGNMPRFDAMVVNDSDLKTSHDMVTRDAGGGSVVTQHPALSWSPAEVESKRSNGLIAFRKPDAKNEACSSCHAPDGIDLAVIAYPDDAILRRAGLHVPAEQAQVILDFIHAQRRHYNIKAPCSTDWRPLQPGGSVLPGDTAKEQDESFWAEIRKRNILVAKAAVETEAESTAAWKELATLNIRAIPNGIPLPRWSEDSFDGTGHKSLNDWLPSVPRAPKNGDFMRLFDDYLAQPTLEKISTLASQVNVLTHDNGFSEIQTGGYRPTFPELFLSKYRGVLIASHYFRMALLKGKGGWDEFQVAPSPMAVLSNGQMINPMQSIGFLFQEDNCFADSGCRSKELASLPHLARIEVGDDPAQFKKPLLETLAHAWWSVATLVDPVLAERPFLRKNNRPTVHYWMGRFDQREIHRPFYNAVIGVKRAEAMIASTPESNVHPLVDMQFHIDFDRSNLRDFNGKRAPYVFLQHNILRMELLQMKRALKAGSAVFDKKGVAGEVALFAEWIDSRRNGDGIMAQAADGIDAAALRTSMATFSALATEVRALIETAPSGASR